LPAENLKHSAYSIAIEHMRLGSSLQQSLVVLFCVLSISSIIDPISV